MSKINKMLRNTKIVSVFIYISLQQFRQGQYGAIIVDLTTIKERDKNHAKYNTTDLIIYCTRPGARIWKVSTSDGQVLNTLKYKGMLAASYKMESDVLEICSKSVLDQKTQTKYFKQKEIAHNFSLLYAQKLKLNETSSMTVLITYNSLGIYLICLENMSNVQFIRLAKKGGSISNVVLDPYNGTDNQENKENGGGLHYEKVEKDVLQNQNVSEMKLKPFFVYVTNSNGFVERHTIQPLLIPSIEPSANEQNDKKTYKSIQADDNPLKVSISFVTSVMYSEKENLLKGYSRNINNLVPRYT